MCFVAGGVAVFGYNTHPGWTSSMPTQRLLRFLGQAADTGPQTRFAGALTAVEQIAQAGCRAIGADQVQQVRDRFDTEPSSYFPHEYLHAPWQPLWSGEVHAALASSGLNHVAQAAFLIDRAEHLLRRAHRAAVAGIAGPFARTNATAILARTSFRIDCFMHANAAPADASLPMLEQWVALMVAPDAVTYTHETPVGMLRFDAAAARAIVVATTAGPVRLIDCWQPDGPANRADVERAATTLFAAGMLEPVDPPVDRPDTARFNAAIEQQAAAGHPFGWRIGPMAPCGTTRVKKAWRREWDSNPR